MWSTNKGTSTFPHKQRKPVLQLFAEHLLAVFPVQRSWQPSEAAVSKRGAQGGFSSSFSCMEGCGRRQGAKKLENFQELRQKTHRTISAQVSLTQLGLGFQRKNEKTSKVASQVEGPFGSAAHGLPQHSINNHVATKKFCKQVVCKDIPLQQSSVSEAEAATCRTLSGSKQVGRNGRNGPSGSNFTGLVQTARHFFFDGRASDYFVTRLTSDFSRVVDEMSV